MASDAATAAPEAPADPRGAPVMRAFRAALEAAYGPRLERAVLFGSRARGDAHAESDWDVAVFLHGMTDRWAENDRLGRMTAELILPHGEVVNAMAFAPEQRAQRTMLMWSIRREGLDL